jgi:hypothetical protein
LIFTSSGSSKRRRDTTAFPCLVICVIESRRPNALALRQNGGLD